jgi:hypothetical protein
MAFIAIVTSDLFLAAKVQALLLREGLASARVGPDRLASLDGPAALVLDLGLGPELRQRVAAWAKGKMPVVAFGAHVDRDALAWARGAGLAAVLTKGQLETRIGRAVLAALKPER